MLKAGPPQDLQEARAGKFKMRHYQIIDEFDRLANRLCDLARALKRLHTAVCAIDSVVACEIGRLLEEPKPRRRQSDRKSLN